MVQSILATRHLGGAFYCLHRGTELDLFDTGIA